LVYYSADLLVHQSADKMVDLKEQEMAVERVVERVVKSDNILAVKMVVMLGNQKDFETAVWRVFESVV
jgi:hypothetical protein